MKILTVIFLTGMAFVAGSPAFAGRDESQMVQLRQAIEKQKANNLTRAQQERTGLAGAIGVPGKIGPGTQPAKVRRDPTTHP